MSKKELREREREREKERETERETAAISLFCKLDLHYEKMHCIYFFPGRNVSSTDKKAS